MFLQAHNPTEVLNMLKEAVENHRVSVNMSQIDHYISTFVTALIDPDEGKLLCRLYKRRKNCKP